MENTDTIQENIFSRRIRAGKRTYFFDVKATKSSKDYYIIITESRRIDGEKQEKHKVFLFKEDFGKFIDGLTDTVNHIKQKLYEKSDKTIKI